MSVSPLPAKCQGNQMPLVSPLLFNQWMLNQSVLNGSSSLRRMGRKHFLSHKLAFRLLVMLWERNKGLTYRENKWVVFHFISTLLNVVRYQLLQYQDVGWRLEEWQLYFPKKVIAALFLERKQSCESCVQAVLSSYSEWGIWVRKEWSLICIAVLCIFYGLT